MREHLFSVTVKSLTGLSSQGKLLKTLTEGGKGGDELTAEQKEGTTPIHGKVRVFREADLCNKRPEGSTIPNVPDKKLTFCVTHGKMRGTESIANAMVDVMDNEKTADKWNENLADLGIQ